MGNYFYMYFLHHFCSNFCYFFANSPKSTKNNGGYCSSCFKELKLVSDTPQKEKKEEKTETKAETAEIDPSKIQTDTTHCWECNRKVGLLGFACKCKYIFCAEHRYSDKHTCTFDYKARNQEDLSKTLEDGKLKDKKGLAQ